jgi:hypothetical protein
VDGARATGARWPVRPSRGGLLGCLAGLLLLVLGLALLVWGVRQPLGPISLAFLAAGAVLLGSAIAVLVLAFGFFGLAYELRTDRLVVRAGGRAESVGFDEIEGVYAGARVGSVRRLRGINWPGYHVGLVRGRAAGPLRVYCTSLEIDALSVVSTAERTLVLSPLDPPAFRRELIRRIEESQGQAVDPKPARPHRSWLPHPLVAGTFAVAVTLLALLGWGLASGYAALPELVGLQLDPTGRPAALVPRTEVLLLPLTAGSILALNLALAGASRVGASAAVLLGSTSVLVEAILLLVVLRLLPA